MRLTEDAVNIFREHANTTATLKTPPDPERQNDARADWAQTALEAFVRETRSDFEDSICDLLADLMHFADRHGMSFDNELRRAQEHYSEETMRSDDDAPETTPETTPRDYSNSLSDEEQKGIDALRHRGFAVIVWTPEELEDANPTHVEDRSVELGWEVISDLKGM